MNLPEFKKQFAAQAQHAMKGLAARLVDELLESAYAESTDVERTNPDSMRVILQRTCQTLKTKHGHGESLTYLAAKRIHGAIPDNPAGCIWIDFHAFLARLKVPLLDLPLLDRLIGTLHVFEWKRKRVVALLDKAIAATPLLKHDPMSFDQAAACLDSFRSYVYPQVFDLINYPDFLTAVFTNTDDVALDCDSLAALRRLATQEPAHRYYCGRTDPREKYRWFRERLGPVLRILREALPLTDLQATPP